MILSIIRNIVLIALSLFVVAMWARFILDWVRVFARRWRPRGLVLLVAEATYTVTDPPLRAVRRVIPPLRAGAVAIDFGWMIVMFACLLLISIVSGIR